MADLISASEAKKIVSEIRLSSKERIINEINSGILDKAKKGKTELYYYGIIPSSIRADIIDTLEKNGYIVEYYSCQRDGDSLYVKW